MLTCCWCADVENAYAGLEKKGKGKKGKGAAKATDSSRPEDKKLMHSLDMLGAFATLKVLLSSVSIVDMSTAFEFLVLS